MLFQRWAAQGFTLLELMVVMVIIGISSTLVSVRYFMTPERYLRQEAASIVQALQQAHELARASRQPLQWRADEQGWRFWQQREGYWQAVPATLLPIHDWREPNTRIEAQPPLPIAITTEWIEAPLVLTLTHDSARSVIERDATGRYAVH